MIDSGRLRELRTLAGLSQRRLSKLAGIGPVGIKRLEDGASGSRLPLQVVGRIAAALDVEIGDLIAAPGRSNAVAIAPSAAVGSVEILDVNQARLLRRIHLGDDVRRRLRKVDRELTLPNLLRDGLVGLDRGIPRLAARTSASLVRPKFLESAQASSLTDAGHARR